MNKKLPRINCYRCEFHCNTLTVDVDRGVTPFMIQCRSRSRPDRPIAAKHLDNEGFCKGTATSSFYPKSPPPAHWPAPAWEWYLPSPEEILAMPEVEAEYYRDGKHLKLRPRTMAEPIYHDEDVK